MELDIKVQSQKENAQELAKILVRVQKNESSVYILPYVFGI